MVVRVTWPDAEILVDEALTRELLRDQFPELADLPIRRAGEGFDNYLFQLGDRLVARVPRRVRGVEPLENELRFLEVAARHLTLATPLPILRGSPNSNYAWPWMIASFIDGVSGDQVDDETLFESANALGTFMRELHVRAPNDAPVNPWRSVPLAPRGPDFEARLADLRSDVDPTSASTLFARACSAPPRNEPATWLHGDLHPGNLVFRDGRLVGVVDFGDLCSGDPATDLAGALLSLPYDALKSFFTAYGVDDDATLTRTIGWAVVFGTMMVGLGRVSRPRYMKVGRRAFENATRLSTSLN
jgi:aminoglycoside phosphotransferase (APT) family kinase protein